MCKQRRAGWRLCSQAASSETKTNIAASYAASNNLQSFEAVSRALGISPKDSFETAFNIACIKLRTGDLQQAQDLLLLGVRSGKRMPPMTQYLPSPALLWRLSVCLAAGRESLLDEELTEEQVEQELVPLTLQLAVVAAQSGQHRAALEQCQASCNPSCCKQSLVDGSA